jgi:hypothetical protein
MVQDGEVVIGVEGNEITRHQLQPPGGISIRDEHYGGPARPPARAIRVRTPTERAFMAQGPVAEAFLRSAAAAGTTRLAGKLAEIVSLEASWGREQLVAALERATRFRRQFRDIEEEGYGEHGCKLAHWRRTRYLLRRVGPDQYLRTQWWDARPVHISSAARIDNRPRTKRRHAWSVSRRSRQLPADRVCLRACHPV